MVLRQYGLKLEDTIFKPDFAKNAVLEQQHNGERIRPSTKIRMGSGIVLVLGSGLGQDLFSVPDMFGLTFSDAKAYLEANGLNLGARVFDADVRDSANAFVYRQSPQRMTEDRRINRIRQGQSIDLWLSVQKPVRQIDTTSVPQPPTDNYIFDLESQQQNITKDTFYLNKYHYGGMAFRGSSQFNSHDPKNFKGNWNVLTSEGIKDSLANATRARWVDISGKIDNGIAGATVFNHPQNFRYPQSLRVHPQMPYWAYAPVVDSGFVIPPGGYYHSKFRYFVHDGHASPQLIESYFRQWILSPIKPD